MSKPKFKKSKYYNQLYKLLTDYPETRRSDFIMFNRFLQVVMHVDTNKISAHYLLEAMNSGKLPKWNSIGRERQHIQSQYPALDCVRRRTQSQNKPKRPKVASRVTRQSAVVSPPQEPIIKQVTYKTVQPQEAEKPVKKNKITTKLPPYKPRW